MSYIAAYISVHSENQKYLNQQLGANWLSLGILY